MMRNITLNNRRARSKYTLESARLAILQYLLRVLRRYLARMLKNETLSCITRHFFSLHIAVGQSTLITSPLPGLLGLMRVGVP